MHQHEKKNRNKKAKYIGPTAQI